MQWRWNTPVKAPFAHVSFTLQAFLWNTLAACQVSDQNLLFYPHKPLSASDEIVYITADLLWPVLPVSDSKVQQFIENILKSKLFKIHHDCSYALNKPLFCKAYKLNVFAKP